MASKGKPARRRSGSGKSKSVSSVFWALLVIFIVVSFLKIPQHNTVGGIWGFFEGRAKTVEEWVKGLDIELKYPLEVPEGNLDISFPTLDPQLPLIPSASPEDSEPESNSEPGNTLTVNQIAEPGNVNYDRKEWPHWGRITNCWNVREEVLYRQSEEVVLLNAEEQVTESKSEACYVDSGIWVDPYTGETFTDPAKLDIDHLIPLAYAAKQGGQDWSKEKKTQFANSLEGDQLIAVSASANRSKGAKGPSDWYPTNEDYQCDYAITWITTVNEWGLSVTPADAEKLEEVMADC